MRRRFAGILVTSVALAGWGDPQDLPQFGAMPDEPVPLASSRYVPVDLGTKSFRPVEPMPWGDVNKRVTPSAKQPPPTEQHDQH